MKTFPTNRASPVLTSLLSHPHNTLLNTSSQCHDSVESATTSTTHPSTTERDVEWDRTAAFSDGAVSKTSVSAAPRPVRRSTILFRYFSLLCQYHGASCVPDVWARLLADTHISATSSASSAGDRHADAATEDAAREDEEEVCTSPATTLDFSTCYVGPNTLLALADLCRVRRVELASRQPSHVAHSRSSTAGAVVVVRAVAPLWSKTRPSPSSAMEMCSLLPHLQTLRLVRLSLDFASTGDAETLHGGRVLLYVLEALQGHPSLEVLDLSGNPIASALLPALSRLVQSTPSLTTVVLHETLLLDSEIEMLTAQCQLNALRQEREKKTAQADASAPAQPAASTSLSDLETPQPSALPLSQTQTAWSAQTLREVRDALEVGVTAVPWLLGKSTLYVRRYTAPAATTTATTSAAAPSRTGGQRKSGSYATLDAGVASSTSVLSHAFRPVTGMPYISYDGVEATATATPAVASGSPSTTRESDTAPHVGVVWSPECTEVVRAAFLDRQVARQYVLGGRAVWPNVPLPDDAEACGGESTAHRPTADAISSSRLLRSIRQQLLPPPQAPPGMCHDADAAFLTTAEANYWTIRQTQDRQWNFLGCRLADHLEAVEVHPGEALYTEGEPRSQYLYFLPQEELAVAGAYVELTASGETCRVLPGQWVGEAEALGCATPYLTQALGKAASTTTASAAHALLASMPFARRSTARLVSTSTSSAGVTLWALPVPVAFFYLYAPYQQLQQHFIQRTPMSSFAHLDPVHLASVPVQLENFHCTRTAATAAAVNAAVLCTTDFLTRHVVLLQEGEYLLRTPSTAGAAGDGEAEEHPLLSGNAVVTRAMMDLDAEARSTCGGNSADEHDGAHSNLSAKKEQGAVGKEAALRQYRLRKAAAANAAAAHQRCSASMASGADGVVEASSDAAERDSHAPHRSGAELRPHPSNAPIAHWRYASLPNEAFAAMCAPLRLALTRHCQVVPDEG